MAWIRTGIFFTVFIAHLLAVDLLFRLNKILRLNLAYEKLYGHISSGVWLCLKHIANCRLEIKGCAPALDNNFLVVVANHQSMFDIPILNLALEPRKLRFIAKKELASGIPAISIALRDGEHCIIDRSQSAQAVAEIEKMVLNSLKGGFCICLFPEGTRSLDGNLRKFKLGGLEKIMDSCEQVSFLPVAIHGAWRIGAKKFLPIVSGQTIRLTFGQTIYVSKLDKVEDVAKELYQQIEKAAG